MQHTGQPEPTGSLGMFEKTCLYCGAHFHVVAVTAPESGRIRHYACPACGKSYKLQAASEPEVRLLHGRTDGKDDRYQETMF